MPWTSEDERLLKELTERKQAMQNILQGCVVRVVQQHGLNEWQSARERAEELIANAEQIRKVLEPFDPNVKGSVL